MSEFKTLISTADLASILGDPHVVVIDCRSKTSEAENGERAYGVSHIAGAVYANLDRDLAAPHEPGKTGRHPLPSVEGFTATLSRLGVDSTRQVAVYDDMSGAYAARAWWMIRWMGHDAVAVLDGGWQKWAAEGRPVCQGNETNSPAEFVPHPRRDMAVDANEVERTRTAATACVLDARSRERFEGKNETLDPVAGHIPGALSMQYAGNLSADGTFLPPGQLAERFKDVSSNTICYCGSGVTACHNILAFVHAGLAEPRLYVGSWSDWITDPKRPVA